jgi:glycosyltransferase involved in cell wall biosynthesis
VKVAVDVTPLASPARTGIGLFTAYVADQDGVDVERFSLSPRSDEAKKLRLPGNLAVRAWARLDRIGRSIAGDADVVHGTNFVAPPSDLPTVLTVHDLSFAMEPAWVSKTVASFAAVVQRRVEQGAWVHAPSEHVARGVQELFGTDRVVTVHHGPPSPQLDPGLSARAPIASPYIVAVGTWEPRKNLSTLVTAFGIAHAREPSLSLALVGQPGSDEHVQRAIDALGRSAFAHVVHTGFVPDVQRDAIVRNAAVLAYPSLDEGFGFPILEAQRMGVPVVASNAGSIPEIAGDGALFHDPLDPDALADQLLLAVEHRPTVHAGRVNLERFSWDRAAEGWRGLYELALTS